MKTTTTIGQHTFTSKKEALLHYKTILNSYKFGQSLNDNDFTDVLALINYEYQLTLAQTPRDESVSELPEEFEEQTEDDALSIEDIVVSKVQFNTKCFEVFFSDDTSYYIWRWFNLRWYCAYQLQF